MLRKELPPTTYATVEDVEDTLDLPDILGETLRFTDETHPRYDFVQKLILSAETEIDRRLRKSWRVNVVKDYICDIPTYQWDENAAWRMGYYSRGGDVIRLQKDIRQWDPRPVYLYERGDDGKIIMSKLFDKKCNPLFVQERDGDPMFDDNGDPVMEYLPIYVKKDGKFEKTKDKHYVQMYDGELQYVLDSEGKQIVKLVQPIAPTYRKLIYTGDKIEVRSSMDTWTDVSELQDTEKDGYVANGFWFDYKAGRLFFRTRYFSPKFNAIRISYRYGSDDPVPMPINRLCSIIVASQIINMGIGTIKVGMGGDVSGIKESILRNWEVEMGRIYSEYQRTGSVYAMW